MPAPGGCAARMRAGISPDGLPPPAAAQARRASGSQRAGKLPNDPSPTKGGLRPGKPPQAGVNEWPLEGGQTTKSRPSVRRPVSALGLTISGCVRRSVADGVHLAELLLQLRHLVADPGGQLELELAGRAQHL